MVESLRYFALPLVFAVAGKPEAIGVHGTCFAVRHRGFVYFLTAKHVVQGIETSGDYASDLLVPLELELGRGRDNCARIKCVYFPNPLHAQFEDAADFAVLIPVGQPGQGEFNRVLDLTCVRDPQHLNARAPLLVPGFPTGQEGYGVDYDQRELNFPVAAVIGEYVGPSKGLDGCHTMRVNTIGVGGSNGLSGAPVLATVRANNGLLQPQLVGLVIRGGDTLLHFISSTWLVHLLDREERLLHEAWSAVRPAPSSLL